MAGSPGAPRPAKTGQGTGGDARVHGHSLLFPLLAAMRICLITNPGSGTSAQMDGLRDVIAQVGADVCETPGPGMGAGVAEASARSGYDAVVACGGDGTINEVVNGLMRMPEAARPVFGIVPMGTGNDLARTLGLPPDPRDALALVIAAVNDASRIRPLDVFHLDAPDASRYGVNVAAGGFSGAVGEAMSSELKARWGPLAYLIGTVKALPALTPFETHIELDGVPLDRSDLFNVFVANGRFVAGGKLVTADADPSDGLLDVVLVHAGTSAELAALTARFVAGQHHDSPLVETHRARTVRVSATPEMLFNVDGELVTQEPISLTTHPGALRAVFGHLS